MVRVLDDQRCYRAVLSRDRRFDGWFYTAVLSTGIYCRPSCPARTPKPANVRFFTTAAAAHGAGFRACKRCRPDAVPGSPEWNVRYDVVARAMRLIVDGELDRTDVGRLASRLGYSERQLHRLLVAEVGTGALALARARRADTARVLLETTALDVTGVAFAAGFSSVRQFNDTVREVFAMTPTEIRRGAKNHGLGVARNAVASAGEVSGADADRAGVAGKDAAVSRHGDGVGDKGPNEDGERRDKRRGKRGATTYPERSVRGVAEHVRGATRGKAGNGAGPAPLMLRLPYREPFAAGELFGFLARRAVAGIEAGTDHCYARSLFLPHGPATVRLQAADGHVACTLRLTDLRDLATAVARVRRLLDLDADPEAVDHVLGIDPLLYPLVRACPGRRSPGHVDPNELAVRAVIGQQVSAAAARGVTARLVRSFGSLLPPTLAAADDGLTHLFPSPEQLAEIDPYSGVLGMPGARARAVVGLAQALADGTVVVDVGADPDRAEADLLALDGIGPWTAGYIRMRALGDPDVFLGGDLGFRRALTQLGASHADPAIRAASDPLRPTEPPESPPTSAGGRRRSVTANATDGSQWRPWRSYALHHLWAAPLPTEPTTPGTAGPRRRRKQRKEKA